MLFLSPLFLLLTQSTVAVDQQEVTNEFFDKTISDAETSLSAADFAAARSINRVKRDVDDAEVDDSAMYNARRFEGDIANNGLTSKTVRSFVGEEPLVTVTGVMRNAVRQSYLKWPSGRIPYTISTQYSSLSRQLIAEAIADYDENTCISFVPKDGSDSNYVHIMPDDGCYSLVGKNGGRQVLSLDSGCLQKGIIVHELMHTVGFFHEQSRADRDDYVTVKWENVLEGLQDQFDKYSLNMIDHLGTNYDYGSIMHYGKTAFSKNGKPTIVPTKTGASIGQRKGFSTTDVKKINALYSCPTFSSTSVSTTTRPPKLSETSTTSALKCVDHRSDCALLAGNGRCNSSYAAQFLKKNCPRTCGSCDGASPSSCADSRAWCARWTAVGMCTSVIFKQYMSAYCAASCSLC